MSCSVKRSRKEVGGVPGWVKAIRERFNWAVEKTGQAALMTAIARSSM